MSRPILGLVTLMLAALVISGCSSVPEKAGSSESLVVIKTEFINPDNLQRGYEIDFNFSRDYPHSWVGQYSWDFNVVVVKESGVELESIALQIHGRFRGQEPTYAVHAPLPYEPGRIAIADLVFVHTIRKAPNNGQSSSLSFRQITDQERADLMQALKADARFASWTQ